MPVFENLFPESSHNKAVSDLLFSLADWHALAKLRLHSDSTIDLLRSATKFLGSRLRYFVKHICPEYDTRELPREEAARIRRAQKKGKQSRVAPADQVTPIRTIKTKVLNLLTYKLHALGDYVATITSTGTTDSYLTQTVCSLLFV